MGQRKGRSEWTGLPFLGITASSRYARDPSTVMPSDARLLMGITSFTLYGWNECADDRKDFLIVESQ